MTKNIKVLSINISKKKGTIKNPVKSISLTEKGIEDDAHAGSWHRQISLLGIESVEKFEKLANRKINYGEFAENITTSGIELYKTNPFDRFKIGKLELEVTQIGKKCHGDSCAIFREIGSCVMPKEGIFCKVKKPGIIKAGDTMQYIPKIFTALIITLSDRASKGEYEDKSGLEIRKKLSDFFVKNKMPNKISSKIISDNKKELQEIVLKAKNEKIDIIITTGGTGIGPRDITVDTIQPMLDKEIPGIMEMIRLKYGVENTNALLSRGVAGVIEQSLIFTLPGSVKAVNEYMSEITKTLSHLIYMLHGIDVH